MFRIFDYNLFRLMYLMLLLLSKYIITCDQVNCLYCGMYVTVAMVYRREMNKNAAQIKKNNTLHLVM